VTFFVVFVFDNSSLLAMIILLKSSESFLEILVSEGTIFSNAEINSSECPLKKCLNALTSSNEKKESGDWLCSASLQADL